MASHRLRVVIFLCSLDPYTSQYAKAFKCTPPASKIRESLGGLFKLSSGLRGYTLSVDASLCV